MADTSFYADAREVSGYFNAGDGRSGRPAVVVLHEYWGLNDQIRGVVDRLAKEGFVAFAPDLYHGKRASNAQQASELARKLDWDDAEVMLRSCAEALLARDPNARLGVIGFCMGGGLALMAAARIPEYIAAVPYYGIPTPERADVTKIRGRVQGHFALRDKHVTNERVNALEDLLAGAGVRFELYRYDAEHAFANDRRPEVYSPENAQLAWERTVKFLKEALG